MEDWPLCAHKKGTTFFRPHPHSVTVRRPPPLLASPPHSLTLLLQPVRARIHTTGETRNRSANGDAGCRRRRGRGGHAGPAPDPGRSQEARAGSALPRGAPASSISLILASASLIPLLMLHFIKKERKNSFFPRLRGRNQWRDYRLDGQ
jgi:hypothetical protein